MPMENFDPVVAARVWQRVQAATPCQEKPACPLEGIPVVAAVCRQETKPRPVRQQNDNCCRLLLLVLLWLICGR